MTPDAGWLLRRVRRAGDRGLSDVLVRDGRIAALGPAGSVAAQDAEPVDLDGRVVLPGLWDQHTHLTQWALARARLDVSDAASAAEAAAQVRERLRAGVPAGGAPLVGQGFRDALWPDEPTVALLDEAAGDVPVVLVSGDLHCAWASSSGLRLLGVRPDDVPGLLREDDWMPRMGLLDEGDAVADAAVAAGLAHVATLGVVGVVDLEIADNVAVWRRRAAAGAPPVRVRAGVWEQFLDAVLTEGLRTGDALAPGVTQGPFKVVTDGSLNTRTAYCHDPYPGTSGRGVLTVPPERLVPVMRRATDAGLTCAIHAIGDAANTHALDAFAATGARGSVEHAQLLTAADVERFAALGVTASVQPEHAMDDRDVADHHWAGRTGRAFPLASLHAAGVRLTLGSDAPVAPLDPWAAVDAAVLRSRDGREPWHPEQRLDLDAALAASVDGEPLGLRVGGPADLVVLDEAPAQRLARAGTLRGTTAAGTLVAGRWTHRAW
ncbi:amidohydrolase [Cellulomonas massiliensis]|uniref:amidohydrolase n=1 Tax=Cellulomonas massiliensis TaxID=1465811 RepID=UPI000311DE09|nr:amidohydrolase [Cellulomonas massiliensis]